ncbi:MAG: hypothetical protein JST12_02565 [Armatimonadetes bacterium]|nr:hypothetical protein [Armatimonadota bacterium]MBS1727355.1 hypothetical protein [Armatimonadota bacterium]
MKLEPGISISDLAFCVGETFIAHGAKAVLSGGGAAVIYAPEAYQSHDLDFILEYYDGLSPLLTNLGFYEKHRQYKHPNFSWTLEFPPGPLAIGGDYDIAPTRLVNPDTGYRLDILSPTDCVRDRLTHFLAPTHSDFSALDQAVAVAHAIRPKIDLDLIRAWALKEESQKGRYDLFEKRLLDS